MDIEHKRRIAIACQGGGSHTAFTAGALQRILQEEEGFEIVNELVQNSRISGGKYKHIEVRRIHMLRDLDYPSKLDRDPVFVQDLMGYGMDQADQFLSQTSELQGAA